MTRRHYVMLSAALARSKPAELSMRVPGAYHWPEPYADRDAQIAQHRACCQAVAEALHADNKAFDVPRFMADCGHILDNTCEGEST